MNLFNWLFKHDDGHAHASRDDLKKALARITAVAPHIQLASKYESRLAPAIDKTLGHARELVDGLPAPRDMTPDAWSGDAHLRAMFATPEDIADVIGRSDDVRSFFDAHIAADYVYTVLGGTLVERRVLGVAQEGDAIRTDVARTTVGFEDKRLRFCAETDAALRDELVERIVEQLALEGIARMAEQDARRDALREHRALLAARMSMLGRRGAGMSSLIAPTDLLGDATRLQHDIEENEAALAALGSRADAIDMQLRTMIDLLSAPEQLIHVTRRTLRVNQMNLVVDEASDEPGAEIALNIARIPTQPPQTRAVGIVRIARRDVPPLGASLEAAARMVL